MKAPDAFRTISEVAEELDLPQHVLRFWETRFHQIKPMKRGGGRRYYRPEDVHLLKGIRVLLYSEGFTIRGVQRLLKEKGIAFVAGVGQTGSAQTLAVAAAGEPSLPIPSQPARSHDRSAPEIGAPADVSERDDVLPPSPVPGEVGEARAPFRVPAGAIALSLESRRKIELALSELMEAKRLLDQAR